MSVEVVKAQDGLKDVFGRGWNTVSDQYELPVDEEEHDRLSIQHRVWKLCIGGLYPPDVKEIVDDLLSSRKIPQPFVADVGSGSGIWAVEMAKTFPHAKVIGLDLGLPDLKKIPTNCSFKVADATKGLEEYANQFDILHCRCVLSSILNRKAFYDILVRTLKPGGLLLLGDGNRPMFSPEEVPIPLADPNENVHNTGRSWFVLWTSSAISHMVRKHPDGTELYPLESWIRKDEAMEYLGQRVYYSPINWDGGEIPNGPELGRLGMSNMQAYLFSTKPVLRSMGISEETLTEWHENALGELHDGHPKINMKWDLTWARKRS